MNNADLGLDLLINHRKISSDDEKEMKHNTSDASEDLSENSSIGSGSNDDGSNIDEGSIDGTSSVQSSVYVKKKKSSHEEILNKKREIIYKFDRLERKGIVLPKKFTIASNLEEMENEYDRIVKERTIDASVKFQKNMLITFVSGIEILNDKFDPFDVKLSGWSEHVNENAMDYDDIFEELHEKWKGSAKMMPELRLMFALGGSAMMFHMKKSIFKSTYEAHNRPKPSQGGMFGNIGNLFGNMMGMNNNVRSNVQINDPPTMRGPTDIDNILKEMNNRDNIEVTSITETDFQDDASVNTKKNRRSKVQKRTIDI